MYDCHIKPQLNNKFSEVDFFRANLNKICLPVKLNALLKEYPDIECLNIFSEFKVGVAMLLLNYA